MPFYLIKLFLFAFLLFSIISCDQSSETTESAAPRQKLQEPHLDREKQPLIIAPMVEGLSYITRCKQDFSAEGHKSNLYKVCASYHFNLSRALNTKLNSFEPTAAGKVQVGYTYGVSLLNLYKKTNNGWELKQDEIKKLFIAIKEVGRPVILYMMMNHFDTYNELSKELSLNPDNLMLTQNNTPPIDKYFNTAIIPFTLLSDESIPVNYYRFNAYREILKSLQQQPTEIKNLVKGITMGGEIHQLFPDFKGGTGKFDNIQITDYSPKSIRSFQQWLQNKYKQISSLNKQLGTNYTAWSQIDPPRKNIRTEHLNNFTEHLDSYAHGIVPIFGWLWNGDNSEEKGLIKIYIDGNFVGNANSNLNRLDVYQAVEEITTANTGFHYNLDFSAIKPGVHELLISYSTEDNKEYELKRQEIVFVDNVQSTPEKIIAQKKVLSSVKKLKKTRYWIDHPKPLQDFYFNPLAKEWFYFREIQVEKFISTLWQIAIDSGIDENLLFSHQIPTIMNSSWNSVLFATDKTLQKSSPYQPGITLYGGATHSAALKSLFPVLETKNYAVPEFHPQDYKSPAASYDALLYHYLNNAVFITPYFISFIEDNIDKDPDHGKFLISPENQSYGSNHLHSAIKKLSEL